MEPAANETPLVKSGKRRPRKRTPDGAKVGTLTQLRALAGEVRARNAALRSRRQTSCSLLAAAGVSPAYVSRQAGHHDIGFTVRVYGASLPPTGSLDALSGLGHQMDTSAPKGTTIDLAEARP